MQQNKMKNKQKKEKLIIKRILQKIKQNIMMMIIQKKMYESYNHKDIIEDETGIYVVTKNEIDFE